MRLRPRSLVEGNSGAGVGSVGRASVTGWEWCGIGDGERVRAGGVGNRVGAGGFAGRVAGGTSAGMSKPGGGTDDERLSCRATGVSARGVPNIEVGRDGRRGEGICRVGVLKRADLGCIVRTACRSNLGESGYIPYHSRKLKVADAE